jgi:hypothetical protein
MNKDRRKFLKAFGLLSAGLMIGIPDLALESSKAIAVGDKPAPVPPSGRFYSPRGGCTEAGITLLDKGPRSDRHFAYFA